MSLLYWSWLDKRRGGWGYSGWKRGLKNERKEGDGLMLRIYKKGGMRVGEETKVFFLYLLERWWWRKRWQAETYDAGDRGWTGLQFPRLVIGAASSGSKNSIYKWTAVTRAIISRAWTPATFSILYTSSRLYSILYTYILATLFFQLDLRHM